MGTFPGSRTAGAAGLLGLTRPSRSRVSRESGKDAGQGVRRAGVSVDCRQVLEGGGWAGVSLVEADALRPETLSVALDGAEVAYYLVHSMAVGRHFADVDLIAADNFRTAAEQNPDGLRCSWK